MSSAYVTSNPYPLTGSTYIDVTTNGYRWYFPSGQPQILNWSVSSSKWSYPLFQSTGTQTNFAKIFEGIEEFINVDFKFLGYFKGSASDVGYVVANNAGSDLNITAAYNGKNSNGVEVNDNVFSNIQVLGRAFFPDAKYNNLYQGAPGDVWLNFNNSGVANSTFNLGSVGYTIVLHEILHGLGLKHPHDDGGTGRPSYASLGAKFLDRQWVSVMSYDAHENGGDGVTYGSMPIGPMLLDGIALQFLFGESNFNSGDTKYDLTKFLGNYYNCQWDASGIDTLDGSSLTYGISVELGTGSASNGTNTHNYGFVTTALDQIYLEVLGYNPTKWTWLWGEYENVNGTRYPDYIVGNDLDNVINGGSGDDYLYGGEGNDTLDWDVSLRGGNDHLEGGEGDDTYVLDSYYDEIVELSNEGIDTVYVGYSYSLVNTYLENIRTFSNQTAGLTFTGNAWGNEIDGGQGADTLIGNAGNDTLNGNAGNDFITGGTGDDAIDGGEGSDTAVLAGNYSNYSFKYDSITKKYTVTNTSGSDGTDTLINVEFLKFLDKTVGIDSVIQVVTSPPTIAIKSSSLNLSNTQTAVITFTLSETSANFIAGDVIVAGGTLSKFAGDGITFTALFTPTPNSVITASVRVLSGAFTNSKGMANIDGSDANNSVSLAVNTSITPVVKNEKHDLSIVIDKNIMSGGAPVYLKGLVENFTYTNGVITSHTIELGGTAFVYSQVDGLITTVTRDGEFTQEFTKEINDYLKTDANITYKNAVALVGVQSIDGVILFVAGADGDYVN
jgi:Ca2+-binding RTX toxin-like protein